MSVEDVRALYEAAQSSRDRAIILCLVNGLSPAEFLKWFSEGWKTWFPKDPNSLREPYLVNLVRHKPKKHFPYHVTLWRDACEALRTLYTERMVETGGRVDWLFVTEDGKPMTAIALDKVVEQGQYATRTNGEKGHSAYDTDYHDT